MIYKWWKVPELAVNGFSYAEYTTIQKQMEIDKGKWHSSAIMRLCTMCPYLDQMNKNCINKLHNNS